MDLSESRIRIHDGTNRIPDSLAAARAIVASQSLSMTLTPEAFATITQPLIHRHLDGKLGAMARWCMIAYRSGVRGLTLDTVKYVGDTLGMVRHLFQGGLEKIEWVAAHDSPLPGLREEEGGSLFNSGLGAMGRNHSTCLPKVIDTLDTMIEGRQAKKSVVTVDGKSQPGNLRGTCLEVLESLAILGGGCRLPWEGFYSYIQKFKQTVKRLEDDFRRKATKLDRPEFHLKACLLDNYHDYLDGIDRLAAKEFYERAVGLGGVQSGDEARLHQVWSQAMRCQEGLVQQTEEVFGPYFRRELPLPYYGAIHRFDPHLVMEMILIDLSTNSAWGLQEEGRLVIRLSPRLQGADSLRDFIDAYGKRYRKAHHQKFDYVRDQIQAYLRAGSDTPLDLLSPAERNLWNGPTPTEETTVSQETWCKAWQEGENAFLDLVKAHRKVVKKEEKRCLEGFLFAIEGAIARMRAEHQQAIQTEVKEAVSGRLQEVEALRTELSEVIGTQEMGAAHMGDLGIWLSSARGDA